MSLIALVPLTVIIVFHLLILMLLPIRWGAIRGEFSRALGKRFQSELDRAYLPIPAEIAAEIAKERDETEAIVSDGKQVADWLAGRQQAARIGELYGN
jgi:hypothetical protein